MERPRRLHLDGWRGRHLPDGGSGQGDGADGSAHAPPSGVLGVRWEHPNGRFWAEVSSIIAAKQDDLSTRDQADTQRIPPGGTPGYTVVHIHTGCVLRDNVRLSLAVESLTDEDYRIHGSGLNKPGRNPVIAAEWVF